MRKFPKWLKITGGILASILLILLVLLIFPRAQCYPGENPMLAEGDRPVLIAHGGGNREFPDNTLEAFYNAYSVDPRVMMESDVSITKDGVVILSHDTTLDRKTNVTGAIADWNYTDLIAQRVDFGYTNPTDDDGRLSGERAYFMDDQGNRRYPTDVEYPQGVTPRDREIYFATTLEELLIAFPENKVNVEIKQSGELGLRALAAVLDLLKKHDAFHRVVLASFHEEVYARCQQLQAEGKVPECFMYSPAYDASTAFVVQHLLGADCFFRDKICVFQFPMEERGFHLATARLVWSAHRHNIAVQYWTINDVEDMKKLIDIGADGIMTDYPHRLQEVFESYP